MRQRVAERDRCIERGVHTDKNKESVKDRERDRERERERETERKIEKHSQTRLVHPNSETAEKTINCIRVWPLEFLAHNQGRCCFLQSRYQQNLVGGGIGSGLLHSNLSVDLLAHPATLHLSKGTLNRLGTVLY